METKTTKKTKLSFIYEQIPSDLRKMYNIKLNPHKIDETLTIVHPCYVNIRDMDVDVKRYNKGVIVQDGIEMIIALKGLSLIFNANHVDLQIVLH